MSDNIKFHGDVIINDKNGKPLRAITRGQQRMLHALEDNDIIFVNGPAGTGKSVIATWYGIAGIDAGKYSTLVLSRPLVEAGESMGALPGTVEEKVAPFMQPLFEAIEVIKGKRVIATNNTQPEPVQSKYRDKKGHLKQKPIVKQKTNEDFYSKVTVCPLAHLRGATKAKSFIILDEAQNISSAQMKLMLTRLGYGSKLVICGDIQQSDLDRRVKSGFKQAQSILKNIKGIGFVNLTIDDIVRHKLIKDIICRYEKESYKDYVTTNRDSEYSPVDDELNDFYDTGDEYEPTIDPSFLGDENTEDLSQEDFTPVIPVIIKKKKGLKSRTPSSSANDSIDDR